MTLRSSDQLSLPTSQVSSPFHRRIQGFRSGGGLGTSTPESTSPLPIPLVVRICRPSIYPPEQCWLVVRTAPTSRRAPTASLDRCPSHFTSQGLVVQLAVGTHALLDSGSDKIPLQLARAIISENQLFGTGCCSSQKCPAAYQAVAISTECQERLFYFVNGLRYCTYGLILFKSIINLS